MRIQLIAMLAALAVAGPVALAGCGDDGGIEDDQASVDVSTAEAEGKPSGDLTVSNWALYIDKETIPEFEQATGIDVEVRRGHQQLRRVLRRRCSRCSPTASRAGGR